MPLGDSSHQAADDEQPLLVASGGDEPVDVSHGAHWCQPPRLCGLLGIPDLDNGRLHQPAARGSHSGAGLFNGRGELLGIGSLVVGDALGPRPAQRCAATCSCRPSCCKPILAELRSNAAPAPASRRAWLGLNCVEHGPAVHVLRVSEGSPAQAAGLQRGDRIVSLDDTEVDGLATLWRALWGGGGAERTVTLKLLRDGEPVTVQLNSVDRMTTLRRPEGV